MIVNFDVLKSWAFISAAITHPILYVSIFQNLFAMFVK